MKTFAESQSLVPHNLGGKITYIPEDLKKAWDLLFNNSRDPQAIEETISRFLHDSLEVCVVPKLNKKKQTSQIEIPFEEDYSFWYH